MSSPFPARAGFPTEARSPLIRPAKSASAAELKFPDGAAVVVGAVVAGGAVVGGAVVGGAVVGGAVVGGAVVGGAVVGGGEVLGGVVETGRAVVVVASGAEVVVLLAGLEVVVTAGMTGREKVEAGDLLGKIGIPTPRLLSRPKTRLVGTGRGLAAEVSVRSD
ncbi:MAG TPA: hypothetical protein VJ935_02195 [Acidimicrobiia bacterium]|nr:hypothetical protein [Acidimicrobiia bacterium]